MRGVISSLLWWFKSTLHQDDLAWPDVQALIVLPAARTRPAALHALPEEGLRLFVAPYSSELEEGEWVDWRWPFGGEEQQVIGVVETTEPLILRVHRSFYGEAGRQVPDFLRGYDGLLLLGFPPRRARALVQRTPSKALLEVVGGAYRRREELHNPRAYVQKVIRPLKVA